MGSIAFGDALTRSLTGFMACALALPALALASACEKAPAPPRNDNLANATVLTAAQQGKVLGFDDRLHPAKG